MIRLRFLLGVDGRVSPEALPRGVRGGGREDEQQEGQQRDEEQRGRRRRHGLEQAAEVHYRATPEPLEERLRPPNVARPAGSQVLQVADGMLDQGAQPELFAPL